MKTKNEKVPDAPVGEEATKGGNPNKNTKSKQLKQRGDKTKKWSVKNMGIVDAGGFDGKYWVYSIVSPTGEIYRATVHAMNREYFTYDDRLYKYNEEDMSWDIVIDRDEHKKIMRQIHDSIHSFDAEELEQKLINEITSVFRQELKSVLRHKSKLTEEIKKEVDLNE